jgi:hypothetical protein
MRYSAVSCQAISRDHSWRTMRYVPTISRFDNQSDDPEVAASPTNRLMLAVLEEALVTFQKGLRSRDVLDRRHSRKVDRWVASTDGDELFSFESVCSSLNIDPAYVREGLERIRCAERAGPGVLVTRALRRERMYGRRAWRGRIGSQ